MAARMHIHAPSNARHRASHLRCGRCDRIVLWLVQERLRADYQARLPNPSTTY